MDKELYVALFDQSEYIYLCGGRTMLKGETKILSARVRRELEGEPIINLRVYCFVV